MVKNNKRSVFLWVFIVVIVLAIGLLLFNKESVKPTSGGDYPAFVDEDGFCVGREGIEMGLCCAVWNPDTEQEDWILCELLEQNDLQAFFIFEDGPTLDGLSSIMFSVKLTNTGTGSAGVKISDVIVTATSGGDVASINEIKSSFEALKAGYAIIPIGQSIELNMNIANRVRLDIPSGTEAFTMADGTYDVKLKLMVRDEQGYESAGNEKTVTLDVEQERLSFSIDVIDVE